MISKAKKLYIDLFQIVKNNNKTIKIAQAHSSEAVWANVFHDTIKGRKWLENLPLSPGRMACNYSFLFVLTKILMTSKPKKIVEFGLGESSKLISAFIKNELTDTLHHIVEHDSEWVSFFKINNTLSDNTSIIDTKLIVQNNQSFTHYSYDNLAEKIGSDYDLYIVDGPFGSNENSRLDIISIAERFTSTNDFIIMIDDHHRLGEKQTATKLISMLEKKGIEIYSGIYCGNKDQIVITTHKYRFLTSL